MHLLSNNDDDDAHRDADAEGHARLEALRSFSPCQSGYVVCHP
jgi:hypothetical protein